MGICPSKFRFVLGEKTENPYDRRRMKRQKRKSKNGVERTAEKGTKGAIFFEAMARSRRRKREYRD
jgi:hypothetical protein